MHLSGCLDHRGLAGEANTGGVWGQILGSARHRWVRGAMSSLAIPSQPFSQGGHPLCPQQLRP